MMERRGKGVEGKSEGLPQLFFPFGSRLGSFVIIITIIVSLSIIIIISSGIIVVAAVVAVNIVTVVIVVVVIGNVFKLKDTRGTGEMREN